MSDEKQKTEEETASPRLSTHDESIKLLLNVSGLIFLVWILYLTCAPRLIPGFKCLVYKLLPHSLYNSGAINLAALGDYLGALNCLFAGLAFAAVYVSIKQQSHSLNIQQRELSAQLEEMRDSVQEAREQTKLQLKYQFSDEFYRRMNLLKTIEKDISFRKATGAEAAVKLASKIHQIIQFIRENKLEKATSEFTEHSHSIFIALDKFKVWGNSFLSLTSDIYNQHAELALFEIKKSEARDESERIIRDSRASIKHYQTVLIESTIWGEQHLLLLFYSTVYKSSKKTLDKLVKHKTFAQGTTAKQAKEENYQFLFKKIYFINRNEDIATQISDIYQEYTNL